MKSHCLRKLVVLAGAALTMITAVPSSWADYISTLQGLGPAGWWRFQDSTATAPLFVVTNGGTLGSAANGYVVQTSADTPSLGQPGMIGNSVRFKNPGSTVGLCDSKIEVPWQAGLNHNPPMTIEFWTKPNALGSDSTGFSPLENFNPTGNVGGSRRGWLFYLNNTGRWEFRLGAISGYTKILDATGGTATPGTWQHIAVTWDGNNMKMYINGATVASSTSSFPVDGWVPNAVSFLRMGGSPLTGNNAEVNINSGTSTIGNRGYDGWLQHVAVYTTALTAGQVNAHFAAATTNTAGYTAQIQGDGPAGYWPLSDAPVSTPSNSMVADSGIDGTATGTVFPGVQVQAGPGYTGFGTDVNGLFFDGVSGYIQVADAPHLTNNAIKTAISFTAWVKPQAQDYFRNIITRGFNGNDVETFFRISRGAFGSGNLNDLFNNTDPSGDDAQYYEVGTTDGANFQDAAQFQIPTGDIGNWVFLAGTCDGSNWNLYRNGNLVASVPMDTADGDTGPQIIKQKWTIGSRAPDATTAGSPDVGFAGQTEGFDGSIFEPAIFNYALSGAQIQSLFSAALVPPVFTLPPQQPGVVVPGILALPGIVFSGNSVTFSSYAEGAPTISYQWISNGVPTGVTTTNFTISNIAVGSYTIGIKAVNAYGTNIAQTTFSVINQAATILSQPLPQKRFVGGNPFTLTVQAIGSLPMTNTWMLGNTVVQTGPSLSYTASATLPNGGMYTVILANAGGSATSAPVSVTVLAVPVVSSGLVSGYASNVMASIPVSYWRLDETNGTTAYDFMSGNDGTYNGANLGQPGYTPLDADTAVAFSGLNSYVGNISGTAINFINNTPFTLEAWVNGQAGQPDQSTIIAKGIGNTGTTETEQFALDVSGGNFRFFTTHGGNKYQALAGVGPNGTWQHVVGVYDASTLPQPTLRLYVNGLQVASTRAPYAPSFTTSPVSIGSKRTGNDPNYDGTFAGTIDEVAVYSNALSPSTIAAHYTSAYGSSLAPVLTIQPISAINFSNLPITLSVGAYGSAQMSYQWYQGTPPGGTPVSSDPGDDNPADLFIASLSGANAGNYYCNISNPLLPGGTNTVVVTVSVLAAPSSPPSIPGLVVHLPLNGSLTDATGRGNNGTGKHASNPQGYPVNSAASSNSVSITAASPSPANPNFQYVGGPFTGSQALHYATVATNTGGLTANGTSVGLDDYYVTLGARPDLQFGSSSFSVSYWVRMAVGFGETAPNGGDLPFFSDVTNSTGNPGYCFTMAYGYGTANPTPTTAPQFNQVGAWGISIYDVNANGIRFYGDNGQNPINDGNYHNIVNVVDRENSKFIVYVDGVPAVEYLIAGTSINAVGSIDVPPAAPTAQAIIGQDPTGLYGEDGAFDLADVGVWRRALTPVEAASIFVAGSVSQLSFTGTAPSYPSGIVLGAITKSGSSVTLNWTATPIASYTFSVWRATSVNGAWTQIATGLGQSSFGSGITTGTYTDTTATAAQNFYKVTSP